MIEDPNLTCQILEYFAQDEVKFPANKTVEYDLTEAFPKVELLRLKYHVQCDKENELLITDIHENPLLSGMDYTFGPISGLTSKGSDYVRGCRSRYLDEAH